MILKLPRYYNVIQLWTFIALLVFVFTIHSFPNYTSWVRYPKLLLWSFVSVIAVNLILFTFQIILKKDSFFLYIRYAFIIFFFAGIYATGGVNSAFVMTLLFPLLVSATYLDERVIKVVGTLITILYAALIFADPAYLHDPAIVLRHLLQVLLYAVMARYIYSMVKETLRQKFEKEEAKRRFVELIELDKLKTSFVTIASHQLRTPLSGARWAIDNLRGSAEVIPEKERALVTQISERVETAMAILNEMLHTADTGVKDFYARMEKKPISPGDLIKEVTDELSFLASSKEVTLKIDVVGSRLVFVDHLTIKAALLNVIDNAIRYSPSGIVSITVADSGMNAVEIVIKDNGIGIAPEDLEFVFERFYRGKNAVHLEPNESGVGLYTAKSIIEFHNGAISLSSVFGKGTTVTITLPAVKDPTPW